MWTALSTSPLALGHLGELVTSKKSNPVANRRKASELNCGPLSDTKILGRPCVEIRLKLIISRSVS